MKTAYKDHTVTRGDPFKPGVLGLVFTNAAGVTTPLPVALFASLACTVRKVPALGQPDDSDTDVVGKVTLVDGGIVQVDATSVQIIIQGAVTRLWVLLEYSYDVQGVLLVELEPRTLVRGRIAMGWAVTQTP